MQTSRTKLGENQIRLQAESDGMVSIYHCTYTFSIAGFTPQIHILNDIETQTMFFLFEYSFSFLICLSIVFKRFHLCVCY